MVHTTSSEKLVSCTVDLIDQMSTIGVAQPEIPSKQDIASERPYLADQEILGTIV